MTANETSLLQLPPVGGQIAQVGRHVQVPADVMVGIIRVAYSAPDAYAAMGRTVDSPASLVAAAYNRRAMAYGTPAWAAIAERDAATMAQLRAIHHDDDLERSDDLLVPPHGADARIRVWTYMLLGHDITARHRSCPPCAYAAVGDAEELLSSTNLPRALWGFYRRQLEGWSFLPPWRPAPGSPQAQAFEVAF